MPLLDNISRDSTWKPLLLTMAVGVCGFVASSTRQVFIKLGLQRQVAAELSKKISIAAAKCSYTIFQSAKNPTWDKDRTLLGPEIIKEFLFESQPHAESN